MSAVRSKLNTPFKFLIVVVITSAISLAALAQETLGTLTIRPIIPNVSSNILEQWKKNVFETDEVWLLSDPDAFFNDLTKAGASREIFNALLNRLEYEFTGTQASKVYTFYPPGGIEGHLFVPADLKKTIPAPVLKAIYTHLKIDDFEPPFELFPSLYRAKEFFEHAGLDAKTVDALVAHTIEIDGQFHFFYTPDIWPLLPSAMKMSFIRAYVGFHDARKGLSIDLSYGKADDIAGIAARYAGGRDPKPIEKYLRRLLDKNSADKVTIPLSKILQPFIRKTINTHTACSGANCFNSGISVNEGNAFQARHIETADAFDIVFSKYRFVSPSEPLQEGDLLFYQNHRGNLIHISTYIADDLVYTKNGMSKFNPYVFQTRSQNQKIYFPDGQFTMTVFRIPKKGESVLSPGGLKDFKGRQIFYENNVTPNKCANVYKTAS